MPVDILTSVILPLSLFLIMLGMGMSLRPIDFKRIIEQPKAVLIGFTGQLLLLPLLAATLAILLKLPAEISVGLMIIALAPGGATSNMFSYLSKGDVALSISLTALVSIVTPFTIPIVTAISMNYFMADNTTFEMPILKTIIQLLVITIVPVLLGMIFRAKWSSMAQKIEAKLKWFSVVFMFVIIVLIMIKNSASMVGFFIQAGSATLILNVLVLFAGYQIAKLARLSRAQTITISFEIGIQNGTLALVVAGTLIGNETMMIPAITYGLLMFVTGGLFSFWLNKTCSSK
ncbi:MAG: bile acid:sodium symporter [Gammaproteobacteria bacterium]|nr:MAG: bile acid:sodium symporter [Gammaproteobacteria bacterium]